MKKWYDSDVWQLLIYILAMLLVAFLMSGCKTSYVPMEKFVYRDVVKCDTLHTSDSIFVHDSVSSSQKGDTLFVDRWHKKVVMKTQYKVRVDTFIRRDSIPVPYPVEKQLSKWEQFQLKYAMWSMGAMCALLIILGLIIYRKHKNGKFINFNHKK